MNISNILTIIRIAIIPIIVLCIYLTNPYFGWIAFILFCLAGITDYFDGYLARLRNEVTNFGTFLDPIADKLLVAAVILILTSKGVIKDWDTIPALIILLREITVSGLREYLAGIKISIPVSRIAKAKTFLQLAALGLLILSESNLNLLFVLYLGKFFLWIAGILTLYTAYDYIKGSIKHFLQDVLRFAVNQEYVSENLNLKPIDEIAIFPPVSGG